MKKILGINAYHGDSSACILIDGKLIAAVEEERFRRIKHWAGFPSESIAYCLKEASLSISEIDIIAINSDPKAHFFKKVLYALKNRPSISLLIDRIKNANKRKSIIEEIELCFPNEKFKGKIENIEHHLTHLSSAFHVSPYKKAVVVSVDGFGDFSSGSWGLGNNKNIDIDGRVLYPHSLGTFYQAMTQFIGFPNYGDEYKVMGLAPYGKPKYMDEMRKIVLLQEDGSYKLDLDYFIYHKEKIEYQWENGSPFVGRLFSDKLEELFGPARKKNEELTQVHKDIAHSIQAMYEEAFFNLLNKLYEKYSVENLCIAGGCGMNSVANGKVKRNTYYKNVYIQSAAGDAGGAIGAAFVSYFNHNPNAERAFIMDHAFYGPSFSNEYIKDVIDLNVSKLPPEDFKVDKLSLNDLVDETAGAISQGLVIGWFQGRMEWGPRALGNRSILGDPRRADMKDILNIKIKRRESFRPFAPSVLREYVKEWFEEDDEVPFMMKVFQIKETQRSKIPAVTHADGSGRLQTVYDQTNHRYHLLISKFNDITGVPMVLNTSFNENEPVVCKPEEALDCFLRTKMDVLVLEDFLIRRL